MTREKRRKQDWEREFKGISDAKDLRRACQTPSEVEAQKGIFIIPSQRVYVHPKGRREREGKDG